MRSTTGIELGPDSCVLVSGKPHEQGVAVAAVRVLGPSEWPPDREARIGLLRVARRQGRFARRAVVVAWDTADVPAPLGGAGLRWLREAGFRVRGVLSPPQALAALAAVRPRAASGAAAWVSVNTFGAALAIVRGTSLVYARTIPWSAEPPGDSVRLQLLQRYSLVTRLAPELKHGIATVQEAHHVRVEAVVTCGNLPDLRSLTMPLIEELDMEVEVLDSTDGLRAVGQTASEGVIDFAPVLRVAAGATVARIRNGSSGGRLAAAAGVILALFGAGFWALSDWSVVRPVAVEGLREPAPPAQGTLPPVDGAVRGLPVSAPPPAVSPERSTAEREAGAPSSAAVPVRPDDAPTEAKPGQGTPQRVPVPDALPAPPETPLPRVTSILIGSQRRLAIVDGRIVTAGDSVGSRTVARIDADAVILREPSGREIRLPVRPETPDEVKFGPFAERRPLAAGAPRGGSS